MSNPLVSVVIATWNCGPYIGDALDSVLAQTYEPVEVLVLDDGSTDDTHRRLEPYRDRIRFYACAHRGVAATRNDAIALARGDYVAFLDPDDVWMPDKLAVQVEIARRHPDSGLIACDGDEFDGDVVVGDRLLRGELADRLDRSETGTLTGHFHREFIACTTISCPAQVLVPRPVLAAVGPMRELGATDFDYWLRIAQRFPVTLHRHTLARWRYRPDSMSGPRQYRYQNWDRMKVEVLELHAPRCSREEQRLIRARRADLLGDLSYMAYRRGLEENRAVWRRELRRLFRARPWPPTALAYLAALRTPAPIRQAVVQALRGLRRRVRSASA
jgi:glycosyltransferase involved in cell wall biosynthesis